MDKYLITRKTVQFDDCKSISTDRKRRVLSENRQFNCDDREHDWSIYWWCSCRFIRHENDDIALTGTRLFNDFHKVFL